MSVVVGRVGDGGVWLAADARLTNAYTGYRDGGFAKIQACGTSLVGSTGTPLWASFIRRYEGDPADERSIEEFGLAWVRWAKREGDGCDTNGAPVGCMLVATQRGELWEVCNDGGVTRIPRFHAIGSGAPFALGALHCGVGASRAVAVAIACDACCGGEVQVRCVARAPDPEHFSHWAQCARCEATDRARGFPVDSTRCERCAPKEGPCSEAR